MKLLQKLNATKPDPLSVDISDDGQRFVSQGRTKEGNYPFTNYDNPQVIAETLFHKNLRSQIKARNVEKFS